MAHSDEPVYGDSPQKKFVLKCITFIMAIAACGAISKCSNDGKMATHLSTTWSPSAAALFWWLQRLVELLCSMFITDLVSGLVHLTLDYQVVSHKDLRLHSETTIPAVKAFMATDPKFKAASGRDQFLWDFQIHHDAVYPGAATDMDMILELGRVGSLLTYVTVGLAYSVNVPPAILRIMFVAYFFGAFTQYTHFCAHARGRNLINSPVLRFMQDHGLIIDAKTHQKHHEVFDCNFCIFNGWANPVVDRLRKLGSLCGVFPVEAPTATTRKEIAALKKARHAEALR
jgi:hypothetical protein